MKDNEKIDMDKIVDDYTPYLRKVVQNMVNNNLSEEDKEEIILDTFFVLWKGYKENYCIKSLSSYMAGITRNLVRENINELQDKIKDLKDVDKKIIKLYLE